jgi:3-hydroxymyristoyl/3-hydroxydecanoyl-(acyl carrier protein) dehydratase
MWHTIDRVETLATGEWCAEVQVPSESSWFSGHFPGDPILPGIAQLGLACDTALKALGEHFRVRGFSRIKFRKIIRPGDRLKICVRPKTELSDLYAFRIMVGDDLACSGAMMLEKRGDPVFSGGI